MPRLSVFAALLLAAPLASQTPDRLGDPLLVAPETGRSASGAPAPRSFPFSDALTDGDEPVADGTRVSGVFFDVEFTEAVWVQVAWDGTPIPEADKPMASRVQALREAGRAAGARQAAEIEALRAHPDRQQATLDAILARLEGLSALHLTVR